jgi:hypothetical protein
MRNPFGRREIASVVAAILSAAAASTVQVATANDYSYDHDRDSDKGGDQVGRYVTGDFHNHTTCSDGTISLKKLVDKSTRTFGLDWFVQAGHGGTGARNCTLAEDPFEPVPPALGLTVPPTIPSSGQPASDGAGPNQTWTSTIGNAAIKGDMSGTEAVRNMWRWQSIQEFAYPVLAKEAKARNKPIFIGLELNTPGHEHTSMSIVDGQLPRSGLGNANGVAKYEYCFDRNDSDRSRGADNQWDCKVRGSTNNSLLDPAARKIIVASGVGSGTAGHVKSVESVKWMAAEHANTSYFVPAHLERAGAFNPDGNNGFNIEHLRDFNNAAPNIAFGFESMPGHQAESQRGSYSPGAVGGGTYGGTGIYAAQIGGVWDALLGEGRKWWFFASSDYHNRGAFGPDQRESTADFFPGEYTKDHVSVSTRGKYGPQDIVDGLRSGNSFVANGDLIDKLSFVACVSDHGHGGWGGYENSIVQVASRGESYRDRDSKCATMGETLQARPGDDVTVYIVLRDPQGTNNSPYNFPNPSLLQIGVNQPLNKPELDHVDLIGGNVTGKISPTDKARYAGLIGSPAATNPSTKILSTFFDADWKNLGNGWKVMSYRIDNISADQYVRLRGTNLPAAVPYETDSVGNPLLDFGAQRKIPCTDFACPSHMATDAAGAKTSSFDVAAWSDLWFYSNPIFVNVSKRR